MTTDDLGRTPPERIRVLFAFGLTPQFYDADPTTLKAILAVLDEGFRDLSARFGVEVLGGLDDDEMVVGSANSWPWTCYLLCDAPNYDAVRQVAGLVRTLRVGEDRLWRYLKVETRIGRPLFFGAS